MGNVALVTIVHSLEQDFARIAGLFFVVKGFLNDPIQKFTTDHFFRHEIIKVGRLVGIVQPDNVGMSQA
jgi:hypothetical protein